MAAARLTNAERNRSAIAAALGLGTQLLAGMVVCAGLGYYADKRRGGGALFTLLGMFLGLLYGGYEVWKLVRQLNMQDRSETDETTLP